MRRASRSSRLISRRLTAMTFRSTRLRIVRETVSRLAPTICPIAAWGRRRGGGGAPPPPPPPARRGGDPAVHIEEHQARDGVVGAAQPAGELAEERDRQLGRAPDAGTEVVAA